MENVKKRRLLLVMGLIIAAALIASAGVFVFMPVTLNIQQVRSPVILAPGSNAGHLDLSGTIGVSVGSNGTSATITVHPTYQTTYYEGILYINNTDSANSYYITIRVETPLSVPSGGSATLIINTGASTVEVDLTSAGYTSIATPISAGESWSVDLKTYYPEGNPLSSPSSASIKIIYSPESGSPPSP